MTLPSFELHRAKDVEDASATRAAAGEEAAFYCGGTELIPAMRLGLAEHRLLIDLKGIPELNGITQGSDGLRIGAAVTHRELERSPLVRQSAPGFAELEGHVGNVRVRSTGTIGGNLCFAEPHSDPATFLVAWGAELELATTERRRRVGMEDFIRSAFETDRADDEILVAIHLPQHEGRTAVAHRKIAFVERPAATVACRIGLTEGGLSHCAVAVGSISEIPWVDPATAAALDGAPVGEALGAIDDAADLAAERCEPIADLNGEVEYKRALVRVLVRDAARAALEMVRRG